MTPFIEKVAAPGAIILGWLGSFEWRLRNKVDKGHFNDAITQLRQQNNRLESHIWDIMVAQGVKATIEPPDEIKNNNKYDGNRGK